VRVLGIAGSLRRESLNARLLRAAADLLPPGVELERYAGLGELPPYDQDVEDATTPAAVADLRAAIAAADAVLIATPEYNASIPGVLKNAVDWASRPFAGSALRGKPVAVVGASTGLFGAVWAQDDLRRVLRTTGARVIDEELPVPRAHEAFDGDRLADPDLERGLAAIVGELVEAARPQVAAAA
jgi:chromate reductase